MTTRTALTALCVHHNRRCSRRMPIKRPRIPLQQLRAVSSSSSSSSKDDSSRPLRTVVVTGMGAVTPLGNTFVESWKHLLEGNCSITTLEEALRQQHLDTANKSLLDRELRLAQQLPCQVAASVRKLPSSSDGGRTARFVQLALLASRESLQQAQLLALLSSDDDDDASITILRQSLRQRTGVSIGSAMSSVRQIVQASRLLYDAEKSMLRKLSPHFVPSVLSNSASGRLSIDYQLQGPNLSSSTACAAGSHAIIEGLRCLQDPQSEVDVMLVGGTEAAIEPLGLAGFSRLRALSTNFNDTPHLASRPFDRDRVGFVMAEGAAVLVLEELQHALARQVPILAVVSGYGMSGDGHHITSPDPQGRGAVRAMQLALESSRQHADSSEEQMQAQDVGYINAHATSTPLGDDIEARAIAKVFQDVPVFVSSTKGATGHLLGAAGALEAAFTVQALVDQTMPATLNLDNVDNDAQRQLQHVQHQAQRHDFKFAMSNSFGFGGTNASLLFKKWE
jgi:3-oxoacyl-[acyl-carrier-protein] synthase II